MSEEKYTLDSANDFFAINFNNDIWGLLEKADRSDEETEFMINLAHAALLHWAKSKNCKIVNLQRGEFMIALAYIYAQRKEDAIYYAKRCFDITEKNLPVMEDFDVAYANLAIARAFALNQNKEMALKHFQIAEKLGNELKNEQDKKIFVNDLKSEPWFGIK